MEPAMVFRLPGSLLSTLLILPLIYGCGQSDAPPLGKVFGVVTLNGQPVSNASITFLPVEGGRPASGETNAKGEYTLTFSADLNGAKVGKNQVFIGTQRDGSSGVPGTKESIPARFNLKSELFVDVNPGTNQLDFPLEATEAELTELSKSNSKPKEAVASE